MICRAFKKIHCDFNALKMRPFFVQHKETMMLQRKNGSRENLWAELSTVFVDELALAVTAIRLQPKQGITQP